MYLFGLSALVRSSIFGAKDGNNANKLRKLYGFFRCCALIHAFQYEKVERKVRKSTTFNTQRSLIFARNFQLFFSRCSGFCGTNKMKHFFAKLAHTFTLINVCVRGRETPNFGKRYDGKRRKEFNKVITFLPLHKC